MLSKIKRLFKDKPLIDDDGKLLYLKGFVLGAKDKEINECEDFDLDEFKKLKLYISEEEKEVMKLRSLVEVMQKTIEDLSKPKTKSKYKRLTKEEVREIEKIFEKDKNTEVKLIVSTFDTSQGVVSRIKNHKHPLSTPLVIK